MRTLIIAGWMGLATPVVAMAQEAVTRTSPITTMGTTRTPEQFVACMLPAVQKDFPASSASESKGGSHQTLLVTAGPQPVNVAVVDIGDGDKGKSLVVIHTEKPHGQPGMGIIKAARNCT
ncbi:hypothetical protein ABIE56_001880 [Luteibacter sp. 621]|uniref:hypothetical protein n=1 Tax=Luteibacter sp. 621 TaxID=3373916 RepID=UPI003D1EFF5A